MPAKSSAKAKIGVLGASGYTGSELVRLLLRHPQRRDRAAHRRPPRRAGDARGVPAVLAVQAADARLDRWRRLEEGRARSGVLRAAARHHAEGDKRSAWRRRRTPRWSTSRPTSGCTTARPMRRWYGHEHHAPKLQKEAVYGLVEVYRSRIKKARLVANPGCYTSCAQLPVTPLLKAKAIEPDEIVIDAKSGMTGAGRAAKEEMLFSEVSEGFHAYGVGHHRHMAELDQEFSAAAGPRGGGDLHAASGADEPRHPVDDLRAGHQGTIGRGPSCDTLKVLREGAVRACAAVRPDAADPACARLQHDLHRGRQGPRAPAAPS